MKKSIWKELLYVGVESRVTLYIIVLSRGARSSVNVFKLLMYFSLNFICLFKNRFRIKSLKSFLFGRLTRLRKSYRVLYKIFINLRNFRQFPFDSRPENEKLFLEFLLHLKSAQRCSRRPLYYLWQGTRNSSRVINFLEFLLK